MSICQRCVFLTIFVNRCIFTYILVSCTQPSLENNFQTAAISFPCFKNKQLGSEYLLELRPSVEKRLCFDTKHPEKVQKGRVRNIFNDPDFEHQWYFQRSKKYENYLSHELYKVWLYSITGHGVVVGIIGGGIEHHHKDLEKNHATNLSYNFITNSSVITSNGKRTSTNSAGLIAATADNFLCGVGAAPNSKFASLQIFDDQPKHFNDKLMARAISYFSSRIDIYLINSMAHYKTELKKYSRKFTFEAIQDGYNYGRSRLGNVFIIGSGSQGTYGNNCAFSDIHQMKEVFVIGTMSSSGSILPYSEKCTAVLAASLSSENSGEARKIYSTTLGNGCRNLTGGIYASTSISAGILALLMSASRSLSARKIMNLIVYTSIQYDNQSVRNSVGLRYSYAFGFGLLNIERLIKSSKQTRYSRILREHICLTREFLENCVIMPNTTLNFYFYTSACLASSFCVTKLEQVFILISLESNDRKSITMQLTSPRGTKFTFISPRSFDDSKSGFDNWKIKIMGYYGEQTIGIWTLKVSSSNSYAKFLRYEIAFHGTCKYPKSNSLAHDIVVKHLNESKLNVANLLNSRLSRPFMSSPGQCYGRDIYSFTQSELPSISLLQALLHMK